ncbi:MAG TPA: NAD(P)-dependent oxidoreductase [Ilumatobacteraceae bacterium]|nr:NAD(P)-dependent oxidoreductase [Ilumatobacteraceae bacterium]
MSSVPAIRVGFIGLGVMGYPMAGHLAAAGLAVTCFDTDPAMRDRMRDTWPAARVADDVAAVGAASDVVITMLPDGQRVREVALDAGGLVDSMASGSILLDCSSAQPWLTLGTARQMAGNGIAMVDAPVSGAQWGAEAAELVFMVGGSDSDVDRVGPLLGLLGRATFHVGPIGSGHVMKSINNAITAMTFLATAEGLVLGTRAGLDPAAMNAVLNESTGGSWITANHIEPRILSRTFDDPFRLELMLKDVAIATQLSRDLGLPLPFIALCESLYRAADRHAGPGRSLSELVRWVEHLTGVEIRPGGAET